MTSRLLQLGRQLVMAVAFAAIVGRPAFAGVVQVASTRDTVLPFLAFPHDSLPAMLTRVATAFDSGFAAPERELVLRELEVIRPTRELGPGDRAPYKRYSLQVKFRGHERPVELFMAWRGTRAVAFHVRSGDMLLLDAVDAAFRTARAAVLLPPGRVRLHLDDPVVLTNTDPVMGAVVKSDEAKHCGPDALESHSESRGDTLAIHVDGEPSNGNCRSPGFRLFQTPHWHAIAPGRHLVAVDYKGDTNLFTVRVTDTSLALSTIRSSFVTADERIRWRMPSGSFTISCRGHDLERRAACDSLLALVDRRADVGRITFDTNGVSPLREDARAYRYADERSVPSLRSCVGTAASALGGRGSVELRIRLHSGRWVADPYYSSHSVMPVPPDSTCVLPTFFVDRLGKIAIRPLNCPTPTANIHRVVANVLQRSEGTAEWFRDHGQAVPTTSTLAALTGSRDGAYCRAIDSTSMRHPVYMFRAGRYFVATTSDAVRADIAPDGPFPMYLVWVLDSAGTVVHVPGYSSLPVYDFERIARATAGRRAIPPPRRDTITDRTRFVPRDVHVTSMRGGVVLQWSRPPRWPDALSLHRAAGTGPFTVVDVAIRNGALTTMDTTARPATSYRYRLRAQRSSGDSAFSNEASLTMPAIIPQRESWPPEPYLRPAVRGRVLDSLTGQPVADQWLFAGTTNGRTDSLGRYLLFGIPPGSYEVRFPCPGPRRRGMVRTLATRTLEVMPATDAIVDFFLRYPGCEEPLKRTWSGEFRGYYVSGFESSRFKPCVPFESFVGTAYEGAPLISAWVDFSSEAAVQARSRWPRDSVPRQESPPMFVRWRATVEGPGSYGHMGVSMYSMKVAEVLEQRRATGSDCR